MTTKRKLILTTLAKLGTSILDDLTEATRLQRKNLQDNLKACVDEGLVDKIKDDVTGLPAYKVSQKGQKWLANQNSSEPSRKELFESLFEYKDGELYWKVSKGTAKAGAKAGTKKPYGTNNADIYEFVTVDGKEYPAHRLIFEMFHGYAPEFVDHIDRNPLNNKIENLRAASKSENLCNRGATSLNTSGFKGVHFDKQKNKWAAEIVKEGKRTRLGFFSTAEEASAAYEAGSKAIHGEFSPFISGYHIESPQPAVGPITPAAAHCATLLASETPGKGADVIEPPKPDDAPAAVCSDEIKELGIANDWLRCELDAANEELERVRAELKEANRRGNEMAYELINTPVTCVEHMGYAIMPDYPDIILHQTLASARAEAEQTVGIEPGGPVHVVAIIDTAELSVTWKRAA